MYTHPVPGLALRSACRIEKMRGAGALFGFSVALVLSQHVALICSVSKSLRPSRRAQAVDKKIIGDPFEAALRRAAGRPALQEACQRGDLDEMRRLIDEGADVNAMDEDARTALIVRFL